MKIKINCYDCESEYTITAKNEPQFCSFCATPIKLYEENAMKKAKTEEELELDEKLEKEADDEELDDDIFGEDWYGDDEGEDEDEDDED